MLIAIRHLVIKMMDLFKIACFPQADQVNKQENPEWEMDIMTFS